MESVAAIFSVIATLCALLSSPVDSISFIRYPSDVTVHEGEDATFHCVVTDKGNTYVYWQKNKSVYLSRDRNVTIYAPIHPALTERLHVVGYKKNPGKFSLRIHDVNMRDQGIYQCVYFQNVFSYYSPEARLIVLPRRQPSLSCSSEIYRRMSSANDSLATGTSVDLIGSNIQLMCEETFTGVRQNLSSLFWYKSEEKHTLLTPQYCITTSHVQNCVYSKRISIDDLDVSYGCRAINQDIPTDNSCQTNPFLSSTINVTISPSELLHTTVGDNATFTCSTTAPAADLRFQWFLNGQLIQQEKDDMIQTWNLSALTLENINLADNGTVLTCVLYGDNGSLGKGRSVLLVQGNGTVTTDSTPLTNTQSIVNVTSDYIYASRNTSQVEINGTQPDPEDNLSTIAGFTLTLSDTFNMSTLTTSSNAIYSPSMPRNDTEPIPGNWITTTTKPLDNPNRFRNLFLSLNDFPMVIAASALVFAAMCLLVLANVACYIVYKKNRNFRKRRYTLAQIRPGLNDSILLEQLSPKTRQKYSKRSVSSFYSESDGKRSSTQLNRIRQPRKTDSSCSDTYGNGTEFWISSDSDTPPRYSDQDLRPKHKFRKSKSSGSASSAPPNVHYRVIDPLRSDSLIESVNQREIEMHVEPKLESKQLTRTPSSSSSEDELMMSLGPRYQEQFRDSRQCKSLNAGVIPPWHKQPNDRQETPAYAVCDLLGGKIHVSKSFCHNRPTAKTRINKRVSTKSLQDYTKRSSDTHSIESKYDNGKPLRSPRPSSEGSQYDNFKSAAAVGVTLIPDINVPGLADVDRIPGNRRHSFSSVNSQDLLDLEWDTSPCAHNLSPCAHSLSQSDPELDHQTRPSFFADQPLPLTPVAEDTKYGNFQKNHLSVEDRRHSFGQRQRSYSDSCNVSPPKCALDVINESFNSADPISSSSSEATEFEPSPPRSPIRHKHDKVLYRQRRITDRPRPTSAPIRSDYVVKAAADIADDKSLVLFPPYRIQSISGGTDLTDHWMSANPSPNTKRKSVRLVRDPSE